MGSNQLALLVLIPLHRYILCMQHYQQVYREINSNAVVCVICEVKRRHVHSASASAVSFIACPEPKQVESFHRDTISDFCHYKWAWCIDIRGLLLGLDQICFFFCPFCFSFLLKFFAFYYTHFAFNYTHFASHDEVMLHKFAAPISSAILVDLSSCCSHQQ